MYFAKTIAYEFYGLYISSQVIYILIRMTIICIEGGILSLKELIVT